MDLISLLMPAVKKFLDRPLITSIKNLICQSHIGPRACSTLSMNPTSVFCNLSIMSIVVEFSGSSSLLLLSSTSSSIVRKLCVDAVKQCASGGPHHEVSFYEYRGILTRVFLLADLNPMMLATKELTVLQLLYSELADRHADLSKGRASFEAIKKKRCPIRNIFVTIDGTAQVQNGANLAFQWLKCHFLKYLNRMVTWENIHVPAAAGGGGEGIGYA
jgi:hypothetical protein